MSSNVGRRSAVLWAGVSALMPMAAHSQAGVVASAASSTVFTAADKPLILTRTVRRSLPGGREIVATRSYSVRITRNSAGFTVIGELADSQVQAPEQLAALAAIEKSRPDPGMFPIELDARGHITSAGPAVRGQALHRAAQTVSSAVGHALPDPAGANQAQAFVQHVRSNGAGSQWPADLFHPAPGTRQQSSVIDTGGGAPGRVTVEIEAQASPGDGMLQRLRRVVRTELDGTERITSEEWTLSEAR